MVCYYEVCALQLCSCSTTRVRQRAVTAALGEHGTGFRTLTLQLWQQSPSAHCEPSVSLQVVALQHGLVHSCVDDIHIQVVENAQLPIHLLTLRGFTTVLLTRQRLIRDFWLFSVVRVQLLKSAPFAPKTEAT